MVRSLLVILFGLIFSGGAYAKMYKWVDSKGKTHYGDTIPPEYSNQGNVQLDKAGQVVNKTDAALTPAQIQARDEADAKAKQEKIDQVEVQRRDKALLATYTELKEIDANLQRNLGQIDVQIKSNELRINSVQGRLDSLKQQQAGFEKRKQPVPPDVANAVKSGEAEIAHLRNNIAKLDQEKIAKRQRFSMDKARFRELKGMPPEPVATLPVPAPILLPVTPAAVPPTTPVSVPTPKK